MFMGSLKARLLGELQQPIVQLPPPPPPPLPLQPPEVVAQPSRYAHRSIETLVVVLAVITIVAVIAGIIARLCGGRHFGGNGEHDIEGWVERKCRSCIDGGLPPPPPPPPKEESKPAPEEAKK